MDSVVKFHFCLSNSEAEDQNDLGIYAREETIDRLKRDWQIGSEEDVLIAIQRHQCRQENFLFMLMPVADRPAVSASQTTKSVNDVFVTARFIRHYGFNAEETHFMMHVRHKIRLSKLLIGTTAPLQDVRDLTSTRSNKQIARTNDYFMGHDKTVVIESEPVRQGIITESTSFTIVQITSDQLEFIRNPESQVPADPQNTGTNCFSICLYDEDDDSDGNTIRLSAAAAFRLGIRFGHKYRVRLRTDSQIADWRCCTLLSGSSMRHDNQCKLTPQLMFNMLDHKSSFTMSQQVKYLLEIDANSGEAPIAITDSMFASCVSIGLIKSPSYPGHVDFSQLLSRFFSKCRSIYLHDVICIASSWAPEIMNQLDDHWMMPKYFFFKIIQIDAHPQDHDNNGVYLIQKSKTRLIQLPATNSLIPAVHQEVQAFDLNIMNKLLYILAPYHNQQIKGPVLIILSGRRGVGKSTIIKSLSNEIGMQVYEMDMNHLLLDTVSATEKRIKDAVLKNVLYSPCITNIKHLDLLIQESKGNEERYSQTLKQSLDTIDPRSVFFVTCDDANIFLTSPSFAPLFRHHVHFKEPDAQSSINILKHYTKSYHMSRKIDLEGIVKKTSGFTVSDLKILVTKAIRHRHERLLQGINDQMNSTVEQRIVGDDEKERRGILQSLLMSGVNIEMIDFKHALSEIKQRCSKSLGAPEIPEVRWQDVGGLNAVKQEILDTIQLPIQHPELFADPKTGLKRVGLLLHGPPGTGKTLIAKAVATECNINFLSVKGPELISMYVGQSEANVREVFTKARSSVPCVIFFDELDSLAPNRGRSGDSAGVMDRVVSQLLAEMDNIPSGLFIIAASNRADLLDSALLRPGRLDKMIYVGIPEDTESRVQILQALTRKFDTCTDIDLGKIESSCPKVFSGADFYSLVSSAMNQAIVRAVAGIEEGSMLEQEASIKLTMSDFDSVLQFLRPGLHES